MARSRTRRHPHIHTTASLTHTAHLESFGAARVIDRNAPLANALTSEKFSFVVDGVDSHHGPQPGGAPGPTPVPLRRRRGTLYCQGVQILRAFSGARSIPPMQTGLGCGGALKYPISVIDDITIHVL
ncbi:hypothetical protein FIBSPDRAFT_1046136 [Athelia psychrophila]|uniref:Uncharacterized protein n=1 Tax=Athelia psychrophila TaxID=1759441 RepID=A0A166HAF2_9AGAM|nr:hypothetical protein FIBSPDRAFT_1053705 [Fibularhizoctonia sp. CBS 109695]KZP18645.1 hypothetical protein FIBSPDRAFT_1046136 [Fibularhizoctonia sp. CBS 109695]